MTTFRVHTLRPLVLAVVVGTLLAAPATATSVNVNVPGVADVWLAGQPDGTILSGGFPADDVAPANSPVLASTGLTMTAGSPLTFVVTGIVDYNGCAPTSPDGDDGCGVLLTSEFFGVSTYYGPINALVAVFVDDNVPVAPAPAGLDFSTPALQSQLTVAPGLNQVFFAGDGLTGTGSGTVQQFLIPSGATRLFLGSSDGPGANYNNSGSFDVTVTGDDACQPVVTSLPQDATTCALDAVLLDASGVTVSPCAGLVVWEWTDGVSPVGTGPTILVSPSSTTRYSVLVYCDTDPSCSMSASATVTVEQPPLFTVAQVRDVASCNLGLEVGWSAATFLDPSGTGVYDVYRSETSCADALLGPPVLGLTGLSWVDTDTLDGHGYYYVVEAEDARRGTVCVPSGPNNAGAVTRICLGPVTESAAASVPEKVCAPLRASHVGDLVTFNWSAARALLTNEHFHLLRARGAADGTFGLETPEGFTGLSFSQEDASSPLQFFDLRIADACETQSLSDYPPPGWQDATLPCP